MHKYDSVFDAVQAYVAADDTDGIIEADAMTYTRIAVGLGITRSQTGWRERDAWSKFTGQALRALNRLDKEGALVKCARGTDLPEGGRASRTRFYTPQAHAAAAKRLADRQAADAELAQAWLALAGRLATLGITAEVNKRRGLMLDLEAWTTLVELAEHGRLSLSLRLDEAARRDQP